MSNNLGPLPALPELPNVKLQLADAVITSSALQQDPDNFSLIAAASIASGIATTNYGNAITRAVAATAASDANPENEALRATAITARNDAAGLKWPLTIMQVKEKEVVVKEKNNRTIKGGGVNRNAPSISNFASSIIPPAIIISMRNKEFVNLGQLTDEYCNKHLGVWSKLSKDSKTKEYKDLPEGKDQFQITKLEFSQATTRLIEAARLAK